MQVGAYSIADAGGLLPLTGMAMNAIQFFGLKSTATSRSQQPHRPPYRRQTVPPTGGCHVSDVRDAWATGFMVAIAITSSSTINGWTLGVILPSGQAIVTGRDATYAPASGAVKATNLSYDGSIGPGTSVASGSQARHIGSASALTSFYPKRLGRQHRLNPARNTAP